MSLDEALQAQIDFETLETGTNALSTSLWEMEVTKHHYVPKVSMLAMYLESPDSTMAKKASVDPSDFLDLTYTDMIEAELDKVKNFSVKKIIVDSTEKSSGKRRRGTEDEDLQQQNATSALSFRQPTGLCGKGSAIRACFEI